MTHPSLRHFIGRAFGYLLMMVPVDVMANVTATATNQGLEYAPLDDVSIDKEELFVSRDKIDIFYTFYNHSDKEVKSQVVFHLPPIPNDGKIVPERMGRVSEVDPLWGPYQLIQEGTRELATDQERFVENGAVPLHTSLNWRLSFPQTGSSYWDKDRVARISDKGKLSGEHVGVEWHPTLRYRAVDKKGKDITKILQEHNIPVSVIAVFGAFDYIGAVENDPELVKRLQKLDLIDIKHKDHAQWSNQISYVWEESFPSKKPFEVKHSYSPCLGFGEGGDDQFFKGLKPIDGDMKTFEETADQRKKGCFYTELKYVLTTRGGWKGETIKDFTITIPKPEKDVLLATNFPGTFKVLANGDYQCHVSGFKPPQEPLRLVWFASANSQPLLKSKDKSTEDKAADKTSDDSVATNVKEEEAAVTTDLKSNVKRATPFNEPTETTETSETSTKD